MRTGAGDGGGALPGAPGKHPRCRLARHARRPIVETERRALVQGYRAGAQPYLEAGEALSRPRLRQDACRIGELEMIKESDVEMSIAEQAAHWWVVFHDGDASMDDHREFREWVMRSPERVEAYLRTA